MPRIESLAPKKRRPQTLVLTFEGGETMDIHVEVVTRHGIYSGVELTEEALCRAIAEDEEVRCNEAAWRLLSHRPRSREELRRGLRQRKFLKSTVERVVGGLEEKGFLNDEAFARQFVEERKNRRDGARLIEQQLRQRGIARETIQESLEERRDPEAEREAARELLRKWNRRTKPEDPRKRRLAAAQFLARRGYEPEMIWGAVREVIQADEEDW